MPSDADFPRPPGHGAPRPRERPLAQVPEDDLRWLDRAAVLGRRGWGRVHPNPMVGCVLVQGGRVLAEGWHREFGGPHAEIDALQGAGGSAAGATAYVSLEPCRHQGKTPACTDALLRAGVARVVYSFADPGKVEGGGGDVLRGAGTTTDGPVWSEAAGRRENPMFFHALRSDRPFVAAKLAVSRDGRIAEAPGRRTAITGPDALREAHRLRAGFDAVMVGSNTARVDDPRLTVRDGGVVPRVAPARIVVDSRSELSPAAALFGETEGRVLVFVGERADRANVDRLERAGATVRRIPEGPGGLDARAVVDGAGAEGVRSILLEGGGRMVASFLAAGLVDRLYLFTSPRELGQAGVPAFPAPLAPDFMQAWKPAFDPERLGEDVLTVYERES